VVERLLNDCWTIVDKFLHNC